ncbi:hypothetical protein PT974_00974 [Cladobotryum mycophilum]|uniref:SMODS and SLOG-associating 2TM effector domain-containing protein n=1 Tax=Cladobotryum mycophilum TaxID=491253 RepID=A0ABR0T2E0_9HYPO
MYEFCIESHVLKADPETTRVYTPDDMKEMLKEQAGQDNIQLPKDKGSLLNDLPETLSNYYSKYDPDFAQGILSDPNAGPAPKSKPGDDSGASLSPTRTSTPTRVSNQPRITVTPPRTSTAAIGGASTASGRAPIPGPDQLDGSNQPPVSTLYPPQNPTPTPDPTPDPIPKPQKPDPHKIPRHRFLSSKEWGLVAHGLGGLRDRESQDPIHPTSWWWPPNGMPQGLYRDVVTQRVKFGYLYHVACRMRFILMFLQLLIGATLTAIGSMSLKDGIPITVLGAANTVIAGLLAFLQNSGLPDRYRYDKAEFEAIEDHIKELLDSGIAPVDQATDQILAECFDLFQYAKVTVASNLPANYTSRLGHPATSQISSNVIMRATSQPFFKPSSEGSTEKHVYA